MATVIHAAATTPITGIRIRFPATLSTIAVEFCTSSGRFLRNTTIRWVVRLFSTLMAPAIASTRSSGAAGA